MVKKASNTAVDNVDNETKADKIESSNSEEGSSDSEPDDKNENKSDKKLTKKNTNLFLSALEGGTKQRISLIKLLFDTKPKYVLLYDSQLWFVRQLEIFKVIFYQLQMRIYFLMYTNSSEEQRYLTSIRTEKESFEILIREKAV